MARKVRGRATVSGGSRGDKETMAAINTVLGQISVDVERFAKGGKPPKKGGNCFGTFGTFGTAGGCLGTFGSYGCKVAQKME